MRPLDETDEADDLALPVDGFEVEEVSDESTIREFVADWRRRVSREYAMSLLQDHPGDHARRRLYRP
jgi:hypothetical protein